MPRLITEWSTDDPKLAGMLRWIAGMPAYSEERLEIEAMLHTFLARVTYIELGEMRARRRKQRQRKSPTEGTASSEL